MLVVSRRGRVVHDYFNSVRPEKLLLPWLTQELNVCEFKDGGEQLRFDLREAPLFTSHRNKSDTKEERRLIASIKKKRRERRES